MLVNSYELELKLNIFALVEGWHLKNVTIHWTGTLAWTDVFLAFKDVVVYLIDSWNMQPTTQ